MCRKCFESIWRMSYFWQMGETWSFLGLAAVFCRLLREILHEFTAALFRKPVQILLATFYGYILVFFRKKFYIRLSQNSRPVFPTTSSPPVWLREQVYKCFLFVFLTKEVQPKRTQTYFCQHSLHISNRLDKGLHMYTSHVAHSINVNRDLLHTGHYLFWINMSLK